MAAKKAKAPAPPKTDTVGDTVSRVGWLVFAIGLAVVSFERGSQIGGYGAVTGLVGTLLVLVGILAGQAVTVTVAHRLIANGTPYVDLKYREALALSVTYQGGVVLWVGFWALYGHGLETSNLAAIASFGAAYMMVVLIEPLADLAVLAAAKSLRNLTDGRLFERRLHQAA